MTPATTGQAQSTQATTSDPRDHKLLRGKPVAAGIKQEVAAEAARLTESGWTPKLVSIAVGDAEPVALYIRNQKRNAEEVGIDFEERFYPEDTSRQEMLAVIATLNADPRVSGVIIQRPVPDHLSIKELQLAVHPLKDVEGMHPASIGKIVYNDLDMGPCTGLTLQGLEVVVVGHSEIVGKPIAFLLMSEGATVTVCHHMTRNLAVHCRQADAVFVAAGKPGLITGNMIKPGAAVIDIGINQIELEDGSTKVVGDADFESAREVAGWITPVPGGVGPVTVAILMRNTLTALKLQKAHYEQEYGLPPAE